MAKDGTDPLDIIEDCKGALIGAKGAAKAKIYERMGDAYQEMEKAAKASVCYRYAHEGGLDTVAFIDKYAKSLTHSGKVAEAVSLILDTLKQSQDEQSKARLNIRMAYIKSVSGDFKEGKRLGKVAIKLLERAGEGGTGTKRLKAEADNTIGICLWRMAMLDEALEYFGRALALFESFGDRTGISDSNNNMGNVYYHMGDLDRAEDHYERSNAATERISYFNNKALILAARREHDRAEEMLKQCVKKALWHGRLNYIPIAYLNLSDISLEKGDLLKARTWADQALKTIKEFEILSLTGDYHENLSLVLLKEGDLEAAEDNAQRALEQAKKERRRLLEAVCLRNLGMIAREKGDLTAAKRQLLGSIDRLRRLKVRYELAQALVELAKLHLEAGDGKEAGKAASEARVLFEAMGLPLEVEKVDGLSSTSPSG